MLKTLKNWNLKLLKKHKKTSPGVYTKVQVTHDLIPGNHTCWIENFIGTRSWSVWKSNDESHWCSTLVFAVIRCEKNEQENGGSLRNIFSQKCQKWIQLEKVSSGLDCPKNKSHCIKAHQKICEGNFWKKKDETCSTPVLDSTGNYKITSERINALAI